MSRLTLSLFCLLAITITIAYAQRDGRYRPLTTKPTKRPLFPALGRYEPKQKNDGKYYPSNEGKYSGSEAGKYRTSNEGKYTAKANTKAVVAGKAKISGIARGKNIIGKRPNVRGGTVRTTKTTKKPALRLPGLAARTGNSEGRNDFKIVKLYNQEEKDGYHYIYETENGILAEEEGHIVELPSGEGLRSKGFFEFTGDDGSLYRVDYVADDAGFVPQGAHLPPTPPHVIKLLEYLALNAKK